VLRAPPRIRNARGYPIAQIALPENMVATAMPRTVGIVRISGCLAEISSMV
jgi:hypothetical protein